MARVVNKVIMKLASSGPTIYNENYQAGVLISVTSRTPATVANLTLAMTDADTFLKGLPNVPGFLKQREIQDVVDDGT